MNQKRKSDKQNNFVLKTCCWRRQQILKGPLRLLYGFCVSSTEEKYLCTRPGPHTASSELRATMCGLMSLTKDTTEVRTNDKFPLHLMMKVKGAASKISQVYCQTETMLVLQAVLIENGFCPTICNYILDI